MRGLVFFSITEVTNLLQAVMFLCPKETVVISFLTISGIDSEIPHSFPINVFFFFCYVHFLESAMCVKCPICISTCRLIENRKQDGFISYYKQTLSVGPGERSFKRVIILQTLPFHLINAVFEW